MCVAVILGIAQVNPCFRLSAYFVINQPTSSTQWSNGAANLVSWTKGLEDGIDAFDVELARLTDDGLIFVARDGEHNFEFLYFV